MYGQAAKEDEMAITLLNEILPQKITGHQPNI